MDFKIVFLGAFLALAFIFVLNNSAQAQNGSLYLSPSSGNVSVGQTFSIVLRVNTGGTAINAAEGSIVFDQQKFSVTSVSKSGSIFSIWASEPKFSNAEGTIDFAAGVPNPGYSGSNGLVLTINFRAKAATTVRGYTEILLVSGAILANDGQGTNILASLGKATYFVGAATVGPEPITPPVQPSTPVTGTAEMKITSSTHPDEGRWYSNNDPVFQLKFSSDAKELNLVLSRNERSTPQVKYVPPISEKKLEDVEEGVWYLHANYRGGSGLSQTVKYKFQVDTGLPQNFEVTRRDVDDTTNPSPKFSINASDITSGIDRYEAKIGDGDWFKILSSNLDDYSLPFQSPGLRSLVVRAYDLAGNYVEKTQELKIESIKPPVVEKISESDGQSPLIIGTAEPEDGIVVYLRSSSGKEEIFDGQADNSGKWSVPYPKFKQLETYDIHARTVDDRGAISIESNHIIKRGVSLSLQQILRSNFYSLKLLIDFVTKYWIVEFLLVFLASILVVKLFTKKILPSIVEISNKITYIASEYGASKKLKKLDNKTRFELRLLREDLKRELDLLKRIEDHRKLHPDEQYLKNKLENYHNLLKNMKG
ncbi:MAG: cohesin domain-containing protein [bacterium]|nr:cohesin domain-containing protein [bacterium]